LVNQGIQLGGNDIQDLDCADYLGLLDESVRRKNEILDDLAIQGVRIGL